MNRNCVCVYNGRSSTITVYISIADAASSHRMSHYPHTGNFQMLVFHLVYQSKLVLNHFHAICIRTHTHTYCLNTFEYCTSDKAWGIERGRKKIIMIRKSSSNWKIFQTGWFNHTHSWENRKIVIPICWLDINWDIKSECSPQQFFFLFIFFIFFITH